MKNTIYELRKKGYKIKVRHFRRYNILPKEFLFSRKNFKDQSPTIAAHWEINSQGGMTRVDLITPEGVESHGETICSKKDNYNYKRGAYIALARALKKLLPEETKC